MRTADATLCIYMAEGHLPSKLHAAKVLETIVQYVSVDGNRELLLKKVISGACLHFIHASCETKARKMVASRFIRPAGQDIHLLYDLVRQACCGQRRTKYVRR